jgi:hypothetical protein
VFSLCLSLLGRAPWQSGKSGLKHTTELIHAWALNPDLPLLTIVTSQASHSQLLQQYHDRAIGGLAYSPGNIRLVTQQLSRSEHDALLGSIGIHICTSSKEGFGHYINQARAVGALLLVTGDEPCLSRRCCCVVRDGFTAVADGCETYCSNHC